MNDVRLENLVLVRAATAAKGVAIREVAKALSRFAPTELSAGSWAEHVASIWKALIERDVVDAKGRLTKDARPPWAALGLRGATPWKRVVERVIPALGLGVGGDDSKTHGRLSDRDAWAAAVVARAQGLWTDGAPPTLPGLCDALVWRELGLTGTPKRTPPEIRALFAGRVLGEPGAHDRLVRLLAARTLAAPRSDLRALRDALGRRWLAGRELVPSAQVVDPAPSSTNGDLDALAAAVRDAAGRATDGVFGDRKVFISSVWKSLATNSPVAGLDLDGFKRRLIAAHRAGLVSLVRADLVGAMDPDLVAASETVSGEARYHFIVREVQS